MKKAHLPTNIPLGTSRKRGYRAAILTAVALTTVTVFGVTEATAQAEAITALTFSAHAQRSSTASTSRSGSCEGSG